VCICGTSTTDRQCAGGQVCGEAHSGTGSLFSNFNLLADAATPLLLPPLLLLLLSPLLLLLPGGATLTLLP
jgi:hypothetical protein